MAAYSPLGPTEICNLALQEMGQQNIDDIDDPNGTSPLACRTSFWQAVREAARAHDWNCLKKRANLALLSGLPQGSDTTAIGWPGCYPSTPPAYWLVNHAYAGGDLVTWGEAIYYCLVANTSSSNFLNDAAQGWWAQIYTSFYSGAAGNAGGMYEWSYGYALPPDYLLITALNGNDCRDFVGVGSLYEIYVVQKPNSDNTVSNQLALFCNTSYADVKYTAFIQDTTIFDPLFVGAVATLLASKIATQLRADDAKLALGLFQKYQMVLAKAKIKDANERKDRRYDPTRESNFLRSRYFGTNG